MILRKGFNQLRRTASEGVEALKLELKLYSAAVGVPGLVGFQYIVDRFTPLRLSAILEEALRESLEGMQIGSRRLALKSFSAGSKPPQLLAARVYDIGPDALGFDFDTSWESEMVARLEAVPQETDEGPIPGARVPVTVRNLRFEGPIRIVVTHLTAEAPGYGAVLMSLPSPPEIGLDVRIAGGEVTRVPWFRDELTRALQAMIVDEMLWPRRVVIPTDKPADTIAPLLPSSTLAELERTDPLLRAEQALAEQPAVEALQEERLAVRSRAEPAFNINLGVLPDFRALNLTGAPFFGELAGDFDLARANFSSLTELTDTFGLDLANFSALNELTDTFGVDLADLSSLAELIDTIGIDLANFSSLAELTASFGDEIGEQLQASRRRFEPMQVNDTAARWWQFGGFGGFGGLGFLGGGGDATGSANATGALLPEATGSAWWRFIPFGGVDGNATSVDAPPSAANDTDASVPVWSRLLRLGGQVESGEGEASEEVEDVADEPDGEATPNWPANQTANQTRLPRLTLPFGVGQSNKEQAAPSKADGVSLEADTAGVAGGAAAPVGTVAGERAPGEKERFEVPGAPQAWFAKAETTEPKREEERASPSRQQPADDVVQAATQTIAAQAMAAAQAALTTATAKEDAEVQAKRPWHRWGDREVEGQDEETETRVQDVEGTAGKDTVEAV